MNEHKKKYSPFTLHFTAGLRNEKNTVLSNLLLQLAGFPMLTVLSLIYHSISPSDQRTSEIFCTFAAVSVLALMAAVFSGIIAPFKKFRYLYSINDNDVFSALPVSDRQLFLADFLSGLTVYTGPYIVSAALALIIVCASPGSVLDTSYVNDILVFHQPHDLPASFLAVLSVQLLITMVMLYALTVLLITCCGTLTASLICTAAGNILLFVSPAVTGFMTESRMINHFVFEDTGYYNYLFISERICPAGGFAHILLYLRDMIFYEELRTGQADWFIWSVLSVTVFTSAAFILFMKRKSEDVSKPFVFPAVFHILSVLLISTVCLVTDIFSSTVFHLDQEPHPLKFILNPLLISGIIYCVIIIIKNKGKTIRKNIRKEILLWFTASVSSVAIFFICELTNGFGMLFYIPDPSDVAYAEIKFPDPYTDANNYDPWYVMNASGDAYEITDMNKIKNITETDSVLADEFRIWWTPEHNYSAPEPECFFNCEYKITAAGSDKTIRLRYKLKNGIIIDRVYFTETDYTKFQAYQPPEKCNVTAEITPEMLEESDIFCGSTSYAAEIAGENFSFFTGSCVRYPVQYRITDYDSKLFRELCSVLCSYYYSEEECYIIRTKNHILFVPAEYSDLYEKFVNSGTLEELIWTKGV